MNFNEIGISISEYLILKKSVHTLIPIEDCQRLERLKLVYEIREATPGEMPKGIGLCKISDCGIDYLSYLRDKLFFSFKIPIIVSLLTNLLLIVLKQLLPLIL